ncbi:hypothetical protein DFH09DRAFT_1146048 [Mycena vulgaris]|nr:hypothetical protein DFH09DRAFT_1146048 [Mycena vulgaris]
MASSTTQTASPTSSSSSPSATCGVSIGPCGVPSAGTLYLFTFLGTLLLLIIVAGAIISRSLYLRRRQRQLIASGQWVPPAPRVKAEVNLKKKPRIFDAHLVDTVCASELAHWEAILPFSAAYTSPSAPVPSDTRTLLLNRVIPPSESPGASIFSRRRHLSRPPNINIPPPAEPHVAPPSSEKLRAHIAYVIAMPTEQWIPEKEERCCDEQSRLPVLEFGIAEVEVLRSPDDDSMLETESDGKLRDNGDSISPSPR